MGTFIVYIHLNIGKIDDMQINRPRILRDFSRQVNDFLFGPFARIRRRMKIYRVNFHAALRNHIARYRRINTAG